LKWLTGFAMLGAPAPVLVHLGETYLADDDPAAARDALNQACAILDDLNHSDAGQVHAMLRAVEDAGVPSKTGVRP
jgi:hypothetical protein